MAGDQPDFWVIPEIGTRPHMILITYSGHRGKRLQWECTCGSMNRPVAIENLELAKYEWLLHLLETIQEKET